MFVALELTDAKYHGIFGGIFNILTKQKPQLEIVRALGARFGVITAEQPLKPADWKRIEALAGCCGNRMLLPPDLDPPAPLKRATFPRYERQVLVRTTCEIIRRTRMPMYRRVLGFADEKGEYADFLFLLLHHFTAVKVLTQNTSLYAGQTEKMMEQLGAPVLLCEDIQSFEDCCLILAPKGLTEGVPVRVPVITGLAQSQNNNWITGLRVTCGEFSQLCPSGIPIHEFLAALQEFCDVPATGYLASSMAKGAAQVQIGEVVEAVLQAAPPV